MPLCKFLRIWSSFLSILLCSKYLQSNFEVPGPLRSLSWGLSFNVIVTIFLNLLLDCSVKKNQIENNKHYYCAGWNEVSRDNFQWPWQNIWILRKGKKEILKMIKIRSAQKKNKQLLPYDWAFMNMVMLSIVLSLQILSMNKDTMIILPKLGKDKYCKLEGSSLYIA